MTINATLTIDNTPTDVSSLVRRDGLEIRQVLCNSRFGFARDSLVMSLHYDQALAAQIFAATTITVSIDIDSTPRFRGVVRPTSDYIISDDQAVIRIEALDNFFQLEKPLPSRLAIVNKPIYDGTSTCVLKQLTSSTSVVFDSAAPNITTQIAKCYFDKDSSILEAVSDVLYYHGYTPYFTPDGKLTWRAWSVTSLTPTVNFTDGVSGNIRGDAVLTRDEVSSYDGVEMTYSKIYDVDNAVVYETKESFPSTQNGNTILDRMVALGVTLSSARVVDVLDARLHAKTRSVDFVFSIAVERKQNQGWLSFVPGAMGLGLKLEEAEIQASKTEAKIKVKADNSGYGGTKLDELRLVAKLRVEEGGFVVRSTPAGSNPERINARYLYDQQTAQDWVDAYAKNVVKNPYIVRLNSYADHPIGAIASVNSTVGNINLTGVIASKSWRHPEGLYTYEVRALSAITPATSSPLSLPDTIPTVEDMEELTVGTQEEPLMTVTPQDPVTVTRGLKVYAGGKRMLELSYVHRSSLALETSGHSFAGGSFSFDTDGNGWYVTESNALARITPDYQVTTWTTAIINSQTVTVTYLSKTLFKRNSTPYLFCFYNNTWYLVDAQTRTQVGQALTPGVGTINHVFFIDGRVFVSLPTDNTFAVSDSWPPTSWSYPVLNDQGFLFPHNERAHYLTQTKLYRIEGNSLVDIGDYKFTNTTNYLDSLYRRDNITKLQAYEGTTLGVLTLDGDDVSFEPTTGSVYASLAYVAGAWYGRDGTAIKRASGLLIDSQDQTVVSGAFVQVFRWNTGDAELLAVVNSNSTLSVYRTVDYVRYINAPSLPPIGSIQAYAGTTDPEGWMICDGRAISRTEYAELFALIGTTWGAGNNSTTFNIPNFQGAFLRGAGTQAIPNDITYNGGQLGQYQRATRISEQVAYAHDIKGIAETDGQTQQNFAIYEIGNNASYTRPVYRLRPFNYAVSWIIRVK